MTYMSLYSQAVQIPQVKTRHSVTSEVLSQPDLSLRQEYDLHLIKIPLHLDCESIYSRSHKKFSK